MRNGWLQVASSFSAAWPGVTPAATAGSGRAGLSTETPGTALRGYARSPALVAGPHCSGNARNLGGDV